MALVYLFDARPGAFVALDWDEANDEVTDVVVANTTGSDFTIWYDWKNRTNIRRVVPAGTPETRIGIPPGQRRFLLAPAGVGYESELEGFGYATGGD